MAAKPASTLLRTFSRRSRIRHQCLDTSQVRRFTVITPFRNEDGEPATRPRWAATPHRMVAPISHNVKDPMNEYICNDDPLELDRFYNKFLGKGGADVFTEEVKWLAITHKSYDQGRRGFNDRLALYGRRILEYQATMALCFAETPQVVKETPKMDNDREPFQHTALKGLSNISPQIMHSKISMKRLARLANQVGMLKILRWKPRMPDRLEASGLEGVFVTTIYAIIGATALQRGGNVANRVATERVLKPLGVS